MLRAGTNGIMRMVDAIVQARGVQVCSSRHFCSLASFLGANGVTPGNAKPRVVGSHNAAEPSRFFVRCLCLRTLVLDPSDDVGRQEFYNRTADNEY